MLHEMLEVTTSPQEAYLMPGEQVTIYCFEVLCRQLHATHRQAYPYTCGYIESIDVLKSRSSVWSDACNKRVGHSIIWPCFIREYAVQFEKIFILGTYIRKKSYEKCCKEF
jgi:hypothetical protein